MPSGSSPQRYDQQTGQAPPAGFVLKLGSGLSGFMGVAVGSEPCGYRYQGNFHRVQNGGGAVPVARHSRHLTGDTVER